MRTKARIVAALFVTLASVLSASSAQAKDIPRSILPLCSDPGHSRLIVRPGRDVCGATLDALGRPVAVGLFPEACPDGREPLIDADKNADLCPPPQQTHP